VGPTRGAALVEELRKRNLEAKVELGLTAGCHGLETRSRLDTKWWANSSSTSARTLVPMACLDISHQHD
jgi:hypothetical protein